MKVLWVATKAPWPPVDGGRLLLWNTLEGLAEAGHRVTLIAPHSGAREARRAAESHLEKVCRPRLVQAQPRGRWASLGRLSMPWTIARHALGEVRRAVRDELARGAGFDLVQAEQVQALWACEAATDVGLPVLLRAQNVESDLWGATAELSPFPKSMWLRREARRLARWEGQAVRHAAATLCLTQEDAARLAELAGGEARLEVVPAPFAATLPRATKALPGAPVLVLFGSAGWRPNEAGARWMLERAWPRIQERLPEARLHVFGPAPASEASGIVRHGAPEDSRAAFAPGSLLVVPLHVASGVRMKILEGWARGIPVVATPAAARGLGAQAGHELLVAEGPDGLAAAVERLCLEPGLSEKLVEAGRRHLRREHAAARVAAKLEAAWGAAISRAGTFS